MASASRRGTPASVSLKYSPLAERLLDLPKVVGDRKRKGADGQALSLKQGFEPLVPLSCSESAPLTSQQVYLPISSFFALDTRLDGSLPDRLKSLCVDILAPSTKEYYNERRMSSRFIPPLKGWAFSA